MSADGLVYDVGMHNGDDTAFYLSQGFRVVAIEADPHLVGLGRARFEEPIARGRLEILNVAIADRPGQAEFWISDAHSEWNSFDRASAGRSGAPHHAISVEMRTFRSILEERATPFYVKIDIEGSDYHCLTDLGSLPASLPKFLSWESGDDPVDADGPESRSLLRLAHQIGFTRFKLIDQATFLPLPAPRTPRKAVDALVWRALTFKRPRLPQSARRLLDGLTYRSRLGRRYGWEFSMGTSGPWGDQMPGSWMTYAEAVAAYQRARREHFAKHRPADTLWCDWHAAR